MLLSVRLALIRSASAPRSVREPRPTASTPAPLAHGTGLWRTPSTAPDVDTSHTRAPLQACAHPFFDSLRLPETRSVLRARLESAWSSSGRGGGREGEMSTGNSLRNVLRGLWCASALRCLLCVCGPFLSEAERRHLSQVTSGAVCRLPNAQPLPALFDFSAEERCAGGNLMARLVPLHATRGELESR